MKKVGLVVLGTAMGGAIYYGSMTPDPYSDYRTNLHQFAHYVGMHQRDKKVVPMMVRFGTEGKALVSGRLCYQCGHVDIREVHENRRDSVETYLSQHTGVGLKFSPWTTYDELQRCPDKTALPN